jgi:hypothetical protein
LAVAVQRCHTRRPIRRLRPLPRRRPELVVEVSVSTLSRDLGIKLDLYRRSGVLEYITVLLNPRQVIWRYLSRSKYRDLEPESNGILHSRIFPGLCLDPTAIWDRKKSLRAARQQ